MSPTPGVSFIEQGPVRIADYLLDYITIFHPDLVANHQLAFFSRPPRRLTCR